MPLARLPRRALVAAIGALCAAPAVAAAVPFGANLSRPANATVDCTLIPYGAFAIPSNSTSCTWSGTGRLGDASEAFTVPAGRGVITEVRVKVGPTTGPMQVVVFQSLRPPLGTQVVCCTVKAVSQVFTPAANAVTTIQVNFPVVNDRVLEPGLAALRFDTMGLSVLAPGVPIPAHDTGDHESGLSEGTLGFYPALAQVGEERVGPAGPGGYQPLLQGEWVPTPEGTTPGTAPVSPAVVQLVRPALSLQGPTLSLGLRCTQATPCVGAVRIQSRPAAVQGQTSHATTRTYASSSFSIAPGASKTIRATMTPLGARATVARRTTVAWANVTVGGRVIASRRVTLRRTAAVGLVGGRRLRVTSGRATLRMRCLRRTRCAGVARLQSRTAALSGRGRLRTYGTARFRIAARRTGTVRLRLNAAGRRALARRSPAWVNISLNSRVVTAMRVSLRSG